MKTLVYTGDTVTMPAPADKTSGDGTLVGNIFGIAVNDVKNGVSGEFAIEGVFTLPKEANLVVAAGDLIYWDDSASDVNKTASGQALIGAAVKAELAATTTVTVRLNSAFVAMAA